MDDVAGIGRWGIWCGGFDGHPAATVRAVARDLEADGWGCLWIPESSGRDAMVTASILLEATTTLHVATGIAQIHARHALTTLAAQQTLAEAHGGRFLLGLGVSHAPLIEGSRGLSWERPLATMAAHLDAMDAAVYRGPAVDPPARRVLAALGPKMLGLARDRADGAHPYLTTPEHTATAREILGPDRILAPEQTVVVDTDSGRAREVARRWLALYLTLPNYASNLRRIGFDDDDLAGPSDRLVDALVAHGDVETVVARCREHLDAGADHVAIQVLADADRSVLPHRRWHELSEALAAEAG